MNQNKYGEIVNGDLTYKIIAKNMREKGSCLIGWTDMESDHRDILFTYSPVMLNRYNLQRGFSNCKLYINIMAWTCHGFLIESSSDNRKAEGYLMEKLQLDDNHCDKCICELINGVIHELDVLEGNVDYE